MLRLRPYKPSDHHALASWVHAQATVEMWKPRRFHYPLTLNQLENYYREFEKDEKGWIFTAMDENGKAVGHFCMRLADYERNRVRLGYIIVNPEIKGKGYGRQMIALALAYGFEILGVETVTLGVYEENLPAKRCYEGLGFREVSREAEGERIYIEMEATRRLE